MNKARLAQYHQAYAQATQTVAKTRQVVMLYDGAIRCVRQAREAIAEKRIEDRYKLLLRASEIVVGMQGCLDFEQGGDVARMLYDFYSTMDAQIMAIQRTNSVEACDAVIQELKAMRETWDAIDREHNPAGTPVPVSVPQAMQPAAAGVINSSPPPLPASLEIMESSSASAEFPVASSSAVSSSIASADAPSSGAPVGGGGGSAATDSPPPAPAAESVAFPLGSGMRA